MIRSMTGYGHAEVAGVRLSLSVECKSLNHRHLDIALRLPRGLSALELDARRVIQGAVQRGRVEVGVSVAPIEGAPSADLTINMAQARAYIEMARRAGDELKLGGIPTLQWMLEQPGVITREEQVPLSPEEGWPLLHDGLAKALAELRARRDTEGAALDKELRALLAAMGEQVGVMAARGPAATERKQQRLRERIQALLGATPLDEGRLATEVAMWAEKSDITEELARLRAHMDEFARLLDEGGAVGRTLDFLIQEMNREVNTVGSKADDLELSQAAIAAKSTLEKLREQAQNIE
ncbi:MAG: YicC/YloC family endoribonuclease [Candidatus Rokubacteria bacterium]|nr:YicC/YloC family endoribonuclease [Candidatus Rokubacteria bacterium]